MPRLPLAFGWERHSVPTSTLWGRRKALGSAARLGSGRNPGDGKSTASRQSRERRGNQRVRPSMVVPGDNKPITIGEGHKARSVYITLERQIEHEPTPGCPGCGACSGTWCGPSHRCRTGSRSRGCCKAKSTALSSTRVDTKASLLYHASSPVTGLLSQRHVPRQRTWAINALRRAEGVDEVVFRAVLTTATDGVLRGSCAPEPGWSSGPAAQLCASGRSITGCAPAPAAAFAFAASAMAALEAP